jgi:hypothetical protein
MINESSSLADVAGAVAAALRAIGQDAIVVGGSAATLHAPSVYTSSDIDIVLIDIDYDGRAVRGAMSAIGFEYTKTYMFVHPSSAFTVDFVRAPVAIGNDYPTEFATIETNNGSVRVLRAVDAVCDRLNKFIVWRDFESLGVAVAVTRTCEIQLDGIEAFIERHAVGLESILYRSGYRIFLAELAHSL